MQFTFCDIPYTFFISSHMTDQTVLSLTWSADLQIPWEQKKVLTLQKTFPQDWFGTPTWPPCKNSLNFGQLNTN